MLGLLLVASVIGVKRKPPVTWNNNLVRVARADSQEQEQGQGHGQLQEQGQGKMPLSGLHLPTGSNTS